MNPEKGLQVKVDGEVLGHLIAPCAERSAARVVATEAVPVCTTWKSRRSRRIAHFTVVEGGAGLLAVVHDAIARWVGAHLRLSSTVRRAFRFNPALQSHSEKGSVHMTPLTHVGTYRRVVGVSVERVWENALDWEHLPWLHRSSFVDMALIDRSPEHWRASVTVAGLVQRRVVVELRTDRPHLRYVTRTLEGLGRGTEIRTRLEPTGDRVTRIAVEFHVAGAARLLGRAAGASYEKLYARLWTEDEAMMQRRQALLDAANARRASRAGGSRPLRVPLGTEPSVRARLPLVVDTPRGAVRVVSVAGELHAHPTECPHLGGPLEDAEVSDGVVTCPWHGYRFDVRTGAAVGSHGCRFRGAPRVEVDAAGREITLVWSHG